MVDVELRRTEAFRRVVISPVSSHVIVNIEVLVDKLVCQADIVYDLFCPFSFIEAVCVTFFES